MVKSILKKSWKGKIILIQEFQTIDGKEVLPYINSEFPVM